MGRYKKLLVPIDGSESSIHALKESFKLAVNEGSWITVVSVVPPYTGDLDLVAVGNVLASIRKPCEDALSNAEKIAKAEGALIKTVCEEGDVHERILDLADAENCDLIVMGRRGLRRLERALVGSVTARVIGYGHKDVLVVPKKHAEDITKAGEEELSDTIVVVKKISELLMEKMNAIGVNVVQNNGKHAGQLVSHLHFHVIPRYPNDNVISASSSV